jgi:hypothetical protein
MRPDKNLILTIDTHCSAKIAFGIVPRRVVVADDPRRGDRRHNGV